MSSPQQPVHPPLPLDAAIREVGEALRRALVPVAEAVAGARPGPAALAKPLGIDMGLASRTLRALAAPDAAALVHMLPSPEGLRILLGAAGDKAPHTRAILAEAEAAVAGFEGFLRTFPGGRKGLMAAIAGWLPEARRREEHTAKQAVYQGMSYLVGFQAETVVMCDLARPSATEGWLDISFAKRVIGLRRLRLATPVAFTAVEKSPGTAWQPGWTSLAGSAVAADAANLWMRRFCSEPLPLIDAMLSAGSRLNLVFASDSPPVNVPVTLAWGFTGVRLVPRLSSREESLHRDHFVIRTPARTTVWDTLLHESLSEFGDPRVAPRMIGYKFDPTSTRDPAYAIDQLDLSLSVSSLGRGFARAALDGVPDHTEFLRDVVATAGHRPEEYSVYRCTVEYAPTFVVLERAMERRPLA